MMFKAVILCALACVVQQCMSESCYQPTKPINEIRPVSVKSGYSSGYSGCVSIHVPTSGGAFPVTSISSIPLYGIAVDTDLGLAGELAVSGELPYLTAVAFEGQLETAGEGCVAYSCGDGNIGITEQIGDIHAGAGAGGYGISSIKSCGCKY